MDTPRVADGRATETDHLDDGLEPAQEPLRGAPKKRGLKRLLIDWAVVAVCAVVGAIVLRSFVVETFSIPSGSMLPTLAIGDRILVDRLPGLSHSIQRGTIIVFDRTPGDDDPTLPAHLVKRVIGLPGETISSRGDTVLINGKPIAEPWLPNFNAQPSAWGCGQSAFDIATTKIPAGQYFVMGDCRGNSSDSRTWGLVPVSYIVGPVFLTIWHNGHPWFHWF